MWHSDGGHQKSNGERRHHYCCCLGAMKFRSSSSKSAEKAIGIDICSPSHPQHRRFVSVSTLSSDSSSTDDLTDQMQNENSPHHDAHDDQHAPISPGKGAQHKRSVKDMQPMTAIKIVNKSLRKKSGKISGSTPVTPTWCRSKIHRKEGSVATRKDIADTSSTGSDKKSKVLPLAGGQELLNVLEKHQKWSDKLKRDTCGVEAGNIGRGVSLNMAKGYLV